MESKLLLPLSIIVLALSIIFGSVWIGYSFRKSYDLQRTIPTSAEGNVLNISQAAKYLNMPEEEILEIIYTENSILQKTGSFHGKMFPYFKINDKQYFYKNEIEEWLKDVSNNRREYNTTKGWILH